MNPSSAWSTPSPVGPAPLDQPQYDATIGQAATRFFRKFATFSGRASRSEYWWWVLISVGISIILQLLGTLILGSGFFASDRPVLDLPALAPAMVYSLVILVPTIALTVRRLHDTNRSGWWYLLSVPALIGVPFQLVGLASLDPVQLASGNLDALAIGPLVAGGVLGLIGLVGSIIMLVFLILGPNPQGARFDRR